MSSLHERQTASLTRRRFVKGAGLLGAALACPRNLGAVEPPRPATGLIPSVASVFDLSVERVPAPLGGMSVMATGINGATPMPILHWRQGDEVRIHVTNRLREDTSLHWHGIRLPADMDGVPGLSFGGIKPGETFTYRFPVRQSGTYWYHSHSGGQEQMGMVGALVIDPVEAPRHWVDRDYVVLLSDWTDADPMDIVSNLKFDSDYYNFRQRTVGTFVRDARRDGLGATIRDRLTWGGMNMAPTDISDVSGIIYTYLMNGQPPGTGWTGLFAPGERIRLRFINAASMTLFDVRIPGLTMQVVGADGNDVEPVNVDEFRISPAETYDVIVHPREEGPYTVFVQSEDRTGFARGTLAVRDGVLGPVPPMDPRPLRTMTDMGMAGDGHGGMAGMDMPSGGHASSEVGEMSGMKMPERESPHEKPAPMNMSDDDMGDMDMSEEKSASVAAAPLKKEPPVPLHPGVEVQSIAMTSINRLAEPGAGLENNGRRVLTYADLRSVKLGEDRRPPSREMTLHLTGNMERFIWGFDGKKFSEAEPIRMMLGERLRLVLINDTMMEHPIHLHGLWSELENGQGEYRPYKHTITVKPGERLSYLVSADTPGLWAFHCHLLYHMDTGMFRTVVVS
ncbi:copper resistance system multicopper oxidase [Acetobacter estunensis]|uniref:copper resistance system multicopper oxidase n=1 Tax=Acetobacter estunensis TaxID=104097 RepID=UPI001C2D7665|nr:copper resistance system multicopper oxidase [Acetobacter estunensis]MBV1836770.1 copper resistance system multicopper oxidase [Acetobacter estunensis]